MDSDRMYIQYDPIQFNHYLLHYVHDLGYSV
jgi:hypothetical protein